MDGTRNFLNFQTIRGATRTAALIHEVYSSPEPTNVESQGEGVGDTQIKHRPFAIEYIYMCMCGFSNL